MADEVRTKRLEPSLDSSISLAEHQTPADDGEGVVEASGVIPTQLVTPKPDPLETLAALEALAESGNPRLRRLGQEAAAAHAKVDYVDKLPDPTLGVTAFGEPIETAAGSQRGSLNVTQMIPWLSRLDARAQQAYFEAVTLDQVVEASLGSKKSLGLLVHVSTLVTGTDGILPEHLTAFESTQLTHSASHSVQVLLCIWQT